MTAAFPTEYVVDASVLVAYFVQTDTHHSKVIPYWKDLGSGQARFHLPSLAILETAGIVKRRSSLGNMVAATLRLRQLTELGFVAQYALDEERQSRALAMVIEYNLLGADAVYCALAEELRLGLLTTDGDFRHYPDATVL